MVLEGKGFFIWKIRDCEGGDPEAIASVASQAGLTHLIVKIADGSFSYNIDWDTQIDLVPPLVQSLRSRGIAVWGWHYVYGDAPVGEARKGVERIQQLGLDGYVIDAEAPFKQPGKRDAAIRFMNEVRSALPNLPVALSSYRYPSFHPQIPWREFLEKCDLNMPQVYWQFAHNPGIQLARCLREFQDLSPFRPLVPTGAAFGVGDWAPNAAEIQDFLQTARTLNLSAANFWEWSKARDDDLIDLWDTVRDFSWAGGAIPGDIVERYIAALNSHDPSEIAALYHPVAAHVTASHTINGLDAIRTWYQSFLSTILPAGEFQLTGFEGGGSSRHFSWTANSPLGNVQNGSDIFGLLDGKIVYHFSAFDVSS